MTLLLIIIIIIGWYNICKDWLGCICDVAPLAEAKEDKCRCYYAGRYTKVLWKLVDREQQNRGAEKKQ